MANKYFKPVLIASLLSFVFYVVLFHHLFVTFEVKGIISVKGSEKRHGSLQKTFKPTLKEKVLQNKHFMIAEEQKVICSEEYFPVFRQKIEEMLLG